MGIRLSRAALLLGGALIPASCVVKGFEKIPDDDVPDASTGGTGGSSGSGGASGGTGGSGGNSDADVDSCTPTTPDDLSFTFVQGSPPYETDLPNVGAGGGAGAGP